MPGRTVVTKGACPASTPKSPSAPGTSTCSTSPENRSFSGETRSKWKAAILSAFVPAHREAERQPDAAADRRDDGDVLDLARSQRPVVVRDLISLHLDIQRPELDLRRFRPRDIAGERADQQPDDEKREEARACLHRTRPLPPQASCPSRRPPRWCRPCRRQLPAGGRICPRTSPGSP